MKFIQHDRSGELNIHYKKVVWMAEGGETPAKPDVKSPRWDLVNELGHGDKLESDVSKFENLKAEKISGKEQDEQRDALLKRIDDLVQKIDAFNAGKESKKYQEYKTSLEGLKRRVLTAEVRFNENLAAVEAKKKGGTARVAQGAAEGAPVSAEDKARVAKAIKEALAGGDLEIVKAEDIPQNINKANDAIQAVKTSIAEGTSRDAIENAYGDAHEKLMKVENATKKLIPDANNADRIQYLKDISTLKDQLFAAMHHGLGSAAHNHYWAEKWKDIQKATGSKPSEPAPFIEATIEIKNEREEEAQRKKAAEMKQAKAEALLLNTDFEKAVLSFNAMKDKTGKYQEIYDTFAAISVRAEGKNEQIRHQCRVIMLVQKINLEEYADAKSLFDECKIYFAAHPKEKNQGFDAYAKTIEEGLAKSTFLSGAQKADKSSKLAAKKAETEAKKATEAAERKAQEEAKKAEAAKKAEEARLATEQKTQEVQAAKEKIENEQLQKNANEFFDAITVALNKRIDDYAASDPAKRPEHLRTPDAIKAFRAEALKRLNVMYPKDNLEAAKANKTDIALYLKNKSTFLFEPKIREAFNGAKASMRPATPEGAPADKTQTPDASLKAKQEAIDKDDKSLADELNKILDGEAGKPGLQARVDTFLKIDPKSSDDVIKAREQTKKELLTQIGVLENRITELTFKYELTEAPTELAKVEKKLNGFRESIKTADLNFTKEAPAKAPAKPAAKPTPAPATKKETVEKVDVDAQKLLEKTLDAIENGKLKGKVTLDGFQKWINSSVLRDMLNLKPDAPELTLGKPTDALQIVNRIKDAQKTFGMKLPTSVQGIFGLKTYEKAVDYRPAFKNILSTTVEAAKPADTSEKDPVKNLESFKGKLSDVLKKYNLGKDQMSSLAPSDLKDKNLDEAVKNLDEALTAIKPKRMKLLGILSPILGAKNEPYSAGPIDDTFSINVFASKDEMTKHINDQILNFVRTGSKENKGEEVAAAQADKEFKNARQAFADGDITINPAGSIVAKDGNDWVDKPLKDLNFATKPKVEVKAPAPDGDKAEAYKKANPESPEAVTDHELTGDLRESALAIGNRGVKSEYQVGDIVVYKLISGAIYGANNYRKNGDNYVTVKPMLSRLDGEQGDLGKFTVTESDVALMKPLIEMSKGENAILTASRETNPKFAEILTLIDTLKGNSSYSKASKYEYVNDNLLSTLHLACEHGKDGKISSPISESLSNYMARQLIAEGVYFRNTYPAMYPHVQAIVQDIIAAHARASEPKKPAPSAEHDRGEALKAQSETTPSELALMTPDQWKKEEMRYAKEGVSEKKSAFASILNALNVSKRTGKSAELMSSALFSPIILSKKNAAGEYEAIKVTYKGFDTTTKSDKVEFSYGDKTFSDLASFVNYIAANADITSFSKSSNEALKAQAARLAPQKEAIKDISNTMEGKLRTLFNKEGKGTDVRGTVIRELKNAFDRSKENHSPYEINSNHALFGTNIFAMENAHMMLEYKGENGKDTTLFIQSFDAKTKKPTDKVEVSGGLDAFIAKLTEIAKANGKVDAEKPAAISATPAPLPDAAPQEEDRGSDTPADADAAYKTLDAEAGALYKTAMKNSKNTINDVPKNAPAWENYLIAEKKILALTEAKKEAPYYTSLLHVAQTEAKLGRLADAKPHLEEVIAFFISHPAVENGLKKKNLAIRVSSAILEYEEKNSKK